jgi:hypothetical protein
VHEADLSKDGHIEGEPHMFLANWISDKNITHVGRTLDRIGPLPVILSSWLGGLAVWAMASGHYLLSTHIFFGWLPAFFVCLYARLRCIVNGGFWDRLLGHPSKSSL